MTNAAMVLPGEERRPKLTVIPANPELLKPGRGARQLRVAAYARVSTEEEEQQSSFEAQIAYFTDIIMSNKEWTLVEVYPDDGITGTLMRKRDGFNRMVRDCKKGKIDMVLTKSITRFARNTVDSIRTIRELKELGIPVIFEKENINTMLVDGETIIALLSVMAQAESESISGNVKWGFRRAFEAGKVFYSYGHWYGYKKGADGRPEIIPEQAEVIRAIYTDFLAGRSYKQIADSLNERDIKRKTEAAWSRGTIQNILKMDERCEGIPGQAEIIQGIRADFLAGHSHRQIADALNEKGVKYKKVVAWSCSIIQSILKNERYCGDAISQKTFVKDCLSKKVVKNNGELPMYYLQDAHDAIIDRVMWHRVQREIARRSSKRKPIVEAGELGGSRYSAKFALTELLVCGECGTTYRRRTWKKKNSESVAMWRCMSRVNYGTKYCKESPSIEETRLHDALARAMRAFLWGREQLLEILQGNLEIALAAEQGRESLAGLRYQQAELQKATLALTETLTGKEDPAAFYAQFEALKAQTDAVGAKIDEIQQAQQGREAEAENLEDMSMALEQVPLELTEYDDDLARLLIDTVRVVEKDRITIRFKDGSEVDEAL